MQRSLKHLKDNGWTVAIVEKWKHFPGMKFGVRQDVWGFGDILACSGEQLGEVCPTCHGDRLLRSCDERYVGLTCDRCHGRGRLIGQTRRIALVQTTDWTSISKHRAKILAIPEFEVWKAAGGLVLLHGWKKRPKDGVRGAKKTWQLKEEIL